MARTKTTLKEQVKKIDNAKKVNPLDLSSDQDLSIGLMNLISIEEHFAFSGAKTGKNGYYDLINAVHDIRNELMARIIPERDGATWCISTHLLSASMRVMEVGTKALSAGNKSTAYQLFDRAYELYSLFWGINMGLIDLAGVQELAPDIYDLATSGCPLNLTDNVKQSPKKHINPPQKNQSVVKKLGDWVKNAVNCCIE